jgi:hypothetical protein
MKLEKKNLIRKGGLDLTRLTYQTKDLNHVIGISF